MQDFFNFTVRITTTTNHGMHTARARAVHFLLIFKGYKKNALIRLRLDQNLDSTRKIWSKALIRPLRNLVLKKYVQLEWKNYDYMTIHALSFVTFTSGSFISGTFSLVSCRFSFASSFLFLFDRSNAARSSSFQRGLKMNYKLLKKQLNITFFRVSCMVQVRLTHEWL